MPGWVWIVIVLAVVVLLGVMLRQMIRSASKEREWYSNASLEEIAQVGQKKLAEKYMVWIMNVWRWEARPAGGPDAQRDVDQLRVILEKIRTVSPEAAREGEAQAERLSQHRKPQA